MDDSYRILFVNGPFDDKYASIPMKSMRHTITVTDDEGVEYEYVFSKLEDFGAGDVTMYVYKEKK
jgi:hypothetical protein